MAKITDIQIECVRDLVDSIPPGRVATYGDIACAAGLSSPRIVAWIMRTDSEDLPWHRVVNAQGRISLSLAREGSDWIQAELLRDEGIPVDGEGRLQLRPYRWIGPTAEEPLRR